MTLDISYSVVRLTMRFDDTTLAYGSGFLYNRNGKYYIVTAWHNLSGRHSFTLKCLHSKNGLPNNLIADMPCLIRSKQDGLYARMSVRFDFDDGVNTTYLVHATGWPRVDVAVIPFEPEDELPHEVYLSDGTTRKYSKPLKYRAYKHYPGNGIVYFSSDQASVQLPEGWIITHTVGDALFLLGFPDGIFDYRVIPIWKRATIATEPSLDWNGQKTFLVDAASRKGMSGGPAIYYSKMGIVPVEPGSSLSIGSPLSVLQGVYVGRVGVGDSEFEAQVGVVWKKSVIDEIVDGGRLARSTHDLELSASDVEEVILANWPKDIDLRLYAESHPPLWSFSHHIMNLIDGRADPDGIAAMVKRVAQEKIEEAIS